MVLYLKAELYSMPLIFYYFPQTFLIPSILQRISKIISILDWLSLRESIMEDLDLLYMCSFSSEFNPSELHIALGPWVTAMKLSCPFQSHMWDPIRILMPCLCSVYIVDPAFTPFAFVYLPASKDRFICLLGTLFSHLLLIPCSILIQLFCRPIQWSIDPWCWSLKTRHPNLILQEHLNSISQWNIY